jgi:hypothetical protein
MERESPPAVRLAARILALLLGPAGLVVIVIIFVLSYVLSNFKGLVTPDWNVSQICLSDIGRKRCFSI